jgi:hypothetical protein
MGLNWAEPTNMLGSYRASDVPARMSFCKDWVDVPKKNFIWICLDYTTRHMYLEAMFTLQLIFALKV